MSRVFKTLKEFHLLMDTGTISIIPEGTQVVEDRGWYKGKSEKLQGEFQDHWIQKKVVEQNKDWFMPA